MSDGQDKPNATDRAYEAAHKAFLQATERLASPGVCWQMMTEAARQFVDKAHAAEIASRVLDMMIDGNQRPND